MENQLIQEFMEEIKKVWPNDEKMQEYCKKKCSGLFKSSGGHLVEFEKPSIETRFCFGYGYNGCSNGEDDKSARDMANYASTNEKYFIRENLEQFRDWEESLQDQKVYLMEQYWRAKTKMAFVRTEEYFDRMPVDRKLIVEELSEEDIEELKKVIENEKQKFIKRLNTYLKRYGLSKVHTWTYLRD